MRRLCRTAVSPMLSKIVLRDPDEGCWYVYEQPIQVVSTARVSEVAATLQVVEDLVENQGWFAAGFVSYEAAAGFDAKLTTHQPDGLLPLVCFGLFAGRVRLQSLDNFPDPDAPAASATHESQINWQMTDSPGTYEARVELIKQRIAAGETYQINLTTQLQGEGQVNFDTFCRIARDAPYGAYIQADSFDIVSASPELFFQCDRDTVTCEPMKGTAPRGFSVPQDQRQAQWLQNSAKNRAENLMITDMVRNDLGRVARPGSVETKDLFAVCAYPTVWQMTSTVTAQTPLGVTDLFRVLFPGASITGAPKRASMAFIKQFETTARGVYTGAIGMLAPGRIARFSVAIRTAWSDKQRNTSCYGAGCGIVWDSDAAAEMSTGPSDFRLIETMRASPDGVFLLDGHLARLQTSADYFGFVCNLHLIAAELLALRVSETVRVRLTLARDGCFDIEVAEIPSQHLPQPIMLVPESVDTQQPWLYHKTTCREVYEKAGSQVPPECEAVLVNREGFVTESVIANLVYQLDGQLFTPPVDDGLLPGILRSAEVAAGKVTERSLPVSQVNEVECWFLLNTLRGWREASLQ